MGQRTSSCLFGLLSGTSRSIQTPLTDTDSACILTPSKEESSTVLEQPRLLVDDIIIDNIFTQQDVHDILNLRQVNVEFHRCSYDSIVWKRILRRAQIHLPPLPPTDRYSFPKLRSIEAERLIARALTLPKHWEKNELSSRRRWDIEAHRIVLEMVLLPGGHYLVASVTDRSRTRYSVEVFTSDFSYSVGFPVARLETASRAFDLRAKYITIHGKEGIVIAYVRRDYRRERYADKLGVDLNDISLDWDLSSKLIKYECTAVHIPLASLELLCDDTRAVNKQEFRTLALEQPRPFELLAEITSRSRISNPVIDEDVLGAPLLAVLKNPDKIVYKNLDGGLGATLQCTPHPTYPASPHTIMAFTILPTQQQFFVVRRAGEDVFSDEEDDQQDPGPYYFAELYNIVEAPGKTLTLSAVARTAIHESYRNIWQKVWISDHGLGPALANDHYVRTYLHARTSVVPNPIIIFVQAKLTYGIYYEPMFPEPIITGDGITYRYTLSQNTPFLEIDERLDPSIQSLNDVYEHRVLAGSIRPIICTVPRHSMGTHTFEVRMLGGIWDKRLLVRHGAEIDADVDGTHDQAPDLAQAEADGEEEGESDTLRKIKLEPGDLKNVSAIAWDETIGRLCVGHAKETRIAVFDFAGAPVPGTIAI